MVHLKNFIVKKFLPFVFAFCISAGPVLAWGENGCSFSNKNKANKEATIEQLENSNSSKN